MQWKPVKRHPRAIQEWEARALRTCAEHNRWDAQLSCATHICGARSMPTPSLTLPSSRRGPALPSAQSGLPAARARLPPSRRPLALAHPEARPRGGPGGAASPCRALMYVARGVWAAGKRPDQQIGVCYGRRQCGARCQRESMAIGRKHSLSTEGARAGPMRRTHVCQSPLAQALPAVCLQNCWHKLFVCYFSLGTSLRFRVHGLQHRQAHQMPLATSRRGRQRLRQERLRQGRQRSGSGAASGSHCCWSHRARSPWSALLCSLFSIIIVKPCTSGMSALCQSDARRCCCNRSRFQDARDVKNEIKCSAEWRQRDRSGTEGRQRTSNGEQARAGAALRRCSASETCVCLVKFPRQPRKLLN